MNEKRANMVGPPEAWDTVRAAQITTLKENGLKPFHYLLDLGCGVLRGGIPIIDYLEISHYYGFEIDPIRLDEGKKELYEMNLLHKNPLLTTTCDTIDRKFDFIWAYQVFIHLTDEKLNDIFLKIKKLLKPGGVCYATVNLPEIVPKPPGDLSWQEYPLVWRTVDFYESIAKKYNLNTKYHSYLVLKFTLDQEGDQKNE